MPECDGALCLLAWQLYDKALHFGYKFRCSRLELAVPRRRTAYWISNSFGPEKPADWCHMGIERVSILIELLYDRVAWCVVEERRMEAYHCIFNQLYQLRGAQQQRAEGEHDGSE